MLLSALETGKGSGTCWFQPVMPTIISSFGTIVEVR